MKTSENVEQLFKAYVEVSPELVNIGKDSEGYGYNYTSLEKLIEHTKPILHKHGLAIIQMNIPNGVLTRMVHVSGEWMESTFTGDIIQLSKMNAYQVQGSQSTYYRRYAWASICGIASDEDKDAEGEQVKPKPKEAPKAKTATILINSKQIADIFTLANEVGLTVPQVCTAWTMKSLAELHADNYDKMIEWLNSQRKA